ncbi:MAG: MATE family efflux transporter, partial [Bacteroidota bacterium]
GTSGFTAQAWGRRDIPETIMVFSRAAFIALMVSVSLLMLQKPIELLSFWLLKGENDVEQLASAYFRIRIWAAPATLGQFALLGFFLGMQNARLPMMVLVSSNLINIIFNYIFVMKMEMGSNGVALGTVIAQYSGLFIAIYFLRKYFSKLFKYISIEAVTRWNKLKIFLSVNKDIFIRTMCLVAVFTFFTSRSASADKLDQGEDTILAVNSILMQFFMFFSFLIDGFAHASEALAGKYVGSKNKQSLQKFIRLVFIWGLGISLLFTAIYFLAGESIFKLLTDNSRIISNAQPYFFWVVLIPVLSFSAFIWDGIFIGATAGVQMRNAMLISTLLVFFPMYFVSIQFIGNHGLWLAFVLFMASRGITMMFLSKRAIYSEL